MINNININVFNLSKTINKSNNKSNSSIKINTNVNCKKYFK